MSAFSSLHGRASGSRGGARRFAAIATVPVGLLLSAALVWQSSQSAFSGTTQNGTNTFAAGTVTLTDDDSGTAMFTVSGLKPGSTGTKCIAVTYNGSLAAAVKTYVAPGGLTGTGLGTYLALTVEEGSVGTFASCGSFVATATIYSPGTLAAFAAASTTYGTGVGTWAPSGGSATKVYRFTYTLADNNSAQNLNASVTFTWEADNT